MKRARARKTLSHVGEGHPEVVLHVCRHAFLRDRRLIPKLSSALLLSVTARGAEAQRKARLDHGEQREAKQAIDFGMLQRGKGGGKRGIEC